MLEWVIESVRPKVVIAGVPADETEFRKMVGKLRPGIKPQRMPGSVEAKCIGCDRAVLVGPTVQATKKGLDAKRVQYIQACWECCHQVAMDRPDLMQSKGFTAGAVLRSITEMFA